MNAREEWDAAMRRHPSAVRESECTFTTTDEDRFHELFTAESQRYPHQALPPEWQDWADADPEPSALHKVAVWVLLDVAAVLVLLVVGRIVWQGISTVVGL